MALGGKVLDIICDLYKINFFNNINSVVDMGDLDVNATYEEIKIRLNYLGVELNNDLWKNAKKFPVRPRVSSSIFWNSIGIKKTLRIDIEKLVRDKNDNTKHIIHDLNFPLNDTKLIDQFDLVTDLGNNEHPFNIVETYRTMHKLCKKNGYMIILQSYLNGNGYYQFDHCTVDNIAAVNQYSIIYSYFIFEKENQSILTPIDKKYFKLFNMNNIDHIGLFYILKKNNNEEFRFPYQGGGASNQVSEYYSLFTSFDKRLPEQLYLPHKLEVISTRKLLNTLFKRLISKFIK